MNCWFQLSLTSVQSIVYEKAQLLALLLVNVKWKRSSLSVNNKGVQNVWVRFPLDVVQEILRNLVPVPLKEEAMKRVNKLLRVSSKMRELIGDYGIYVDPDC